MSNKTESEEEKDLFIGETIFNKYKLTRKIGQGSFGSIYEAKSINSNKLYAIKLEDMKQEHYVLEDEALFMGYLNHPRIPKLKSFGYNGAYIILVMELLGKSLDKIFNELPSKKMSIRCVCNIGYQLILILEIIHSLNIIHRDIKPGNIAIGREEKSKYIYLLDFGLSKKFRSGKTKKHLKFVKTNKLIGNARYSSINAIEGGTQSRRDDLESLGYLLIYLLLGKLPWQGHVSHSKEDKYYKIRQIKKETTPEQLCEGLPPQFEDYLKYTRNLAYEEDPDYNYLKNLFLSTLAHYNWRFDYYYDWDPVCLTASEIVDKEKDDTNINNKFDNEKGSLYLSNKIRNLINERKKHGGIFEFDKYLEEEESNCIPIASRPSISSHENKYDYLNSLNSMTPYPNRYDKKKNKNEGCMPCQPKEFKDKDNACCVIF